VSDTIPVTVEQAREMRIESRIRFAGREWQWKGLPTIAESRVIQKLTGMRIKDWMDAAFDEWDPVAVSALLVVLYARDGEKKRIDEIDGDWDTFALFDVDADTGKQIEIVDDRPPCPTCEQPMNRETAAKVLPDQGKAAGH
jgi:muconolactone delta-isomerase